MTIFSLTRLFVLVWNVYINCNCPKMTILCNWQNVVIHCTDTYSKLLDVNATIFISKKYWQNWLLNVSKKWMWRYSLFLVVWCCCLCCGYLQRILLTTPVFSFKKQVSRDVTFFLLFLSLQVNDFTVKYVFLLQVISTNCFHRNISLYTSMMLK